MAVTINPADVTSTMTLSNGNLTAVGNTGGTHGMARATLARTSGKFYLEVLCSAYAGAIRVGFATSAATLGSALGATTYAGGIAMDAATTVTGPTNANSGGSAVQGNYRMMAIDYDAGKAWIGTNGTWGGSGNPATGANPWITFTANTSLFPAFETYSTGDTITVNFGASAFNYTAPSGFGPYSGTVYSLTPVAGSYALTGVALTLKRGRYMASAAGAYALTGVAVVFNKGKGLLAATGSYTLTGVAALLNSVRKLVPATGAYALTGIAAVLAHAITLVAAKGTYTLTGVAALLNKALHLTAVKGTYTLTGVAALLNKALHLTAVTGAYVLTGKAALLNSARRLTAATGSYILTGIALIVAHFVPPALKFKRRVASFVLQKRRVADPSLED